METSTNDVAGQTVPAATEEPQTAVATAVVQTQTDTTTATTQASEKQGTDKASNLNLPTIGIAVAGLLLVILIVIVMLRTKKSAKGANGKPAAKASKGDMVEIYVGNLSYDMNDAQLRKEFERFGVVKSARVITHRTNGKSKGYGFVEMPHRKEAVIAIKALDNSEILGRRLRVNEARANTRPPEK